jgi:hypothetical protein
MLPSVGLRDALTSAAAEDGSFRPEEIMDLVTRNMPGSSERSKLGLKRFGRDLMQGAMKDLTSQGSNADMRKAYNKVLVEGLRIYRTVVHGELEAEEERKREESGRPKKKRKRRRGARRRDDEADPTRDGHPWPDHYHFDQGKNTSEWAKHFPDIPPRVWCVRRWLSAQLPPKCRGCKSGSA